MKPITDVPSLIRRNRLVLAVLVVLLVLFAYVTNGLSDLVRILLFEVPVLIVLGAAVRVFQGRRWRAEVARTVGSGAQWAASATVWRLNPPPGSPAAIPAVRVGESGIVGLDATGLTFVPSRRWHRKGYVPHRWNLEQTLGAEQWFAREVGRTQRRHILLPGRDAPIELAVRRESSPLPDALEPLRLFSSQGPSAPSA